MGTMLYNGVELPDIESVWTDKVTYPYAVITLSSSGYYLQLHSLAPYEEYYQDGLIFATEGANIQQWLYAGSGEWSLTGTYKDIEYGVTWGAITSIVWLNFDFYKEETSGGTRTLLIAASPDPVDPNAPTIDLPTVQKWMVVGSALRRLILGRQPVAYLYNGVRLPKLPEWDKTVYPYAAILKESTGSTDLTLFFTDVQIYPASWWGTNMVAWIEDISRKRYTLTDTDSDWVFRDEKVDDGSPLLTPALALWTSYDVLNDDGAVYFAASDPVPVYS